VEMERSTLSSRSRKLFTLSSIHSANNALMASREFKNVDEASKTSIEFWNTLGNFMVEWKLVADSKITAGEVRQDYVNSHAIVLQSLGAVGNKLFDLTTKEKSAKLKCLENIDWSRSNASAWEGRAMIGGRMSKSSNNVTLTANYIKQHLGMELTPEEQRVEDAHRRGENG
jgi:DNA sulfur modification protein DndB